MSTTAARTRTLAAFLKRLGGLDLQSFRGRLILQKTVYLLQAFGFYLGYRYNWYLYGPYSPDLTKDAFSIVESFGEAKPVAFTDPSLEQRFQAFVKFLGSKKADAEWLELVASIHFLSKLYPDWSHTQVLEKVKKKQPYFTAQRAEEALSYLRGHTLISQA